MAPVVAACVATLGLAIPVGVFTNHLRDAYDGLTGTLVVFLTVPGLLDSPPMQHMDERWRRRREQRLNRALPAAQARHVVRLSRFGWFLRNALIVVIPLLAVGLVVAAVGGFIALLGYAVVAKVGLAMAGAAAAALVLLLAGVAIMPTRPPEAKLLDGYLTCADVASALKAWSYRKPFALTLLLLALAVTAITGF